MPNKTFGKTPENICRATYQSPIGRLYLAASQNGISEISYSRPAGFKESGADSPIISQAKKELEQYFAGKRKTWNVPLDWGEQNGFYQKARKACARVGYGKTLSYGELAKRADNPKAARAAGTAMATNPISIIVPCHRIVTSQGQTGKYGGGAEAKKWLLNLEQANS